MVRIQYAVLFFNYSSNFEQKNTDGPVSISHRKRVWPKRKDIDRNKEYY